MDSLLAQGLVRVANFAIEADPVLHEACRGLAGRRLAFVIDTGLLPQQAPQTLEARFEADGLLAEVQRTEGESLSEPDLRLLLSPAFFQHAATQAVTGLFERFQPRSNPEPLRSSGPAPAAMKGLRIEGDAAVAERLNPLLAALSAKAQDLAGLGSAHPVAGALLGGLQHLGARLIGGVQDRLQSGEQVLTQAQFQQTAQRLRGLREGLDRLERRLDQSAAMVGVPRQD